MIEKIIGYTVFCDVCGEELNFDGIHILYDTKKELMKICRENGWKVKKEKWVCDKCNEKFENQMI